VIALKCSKGALKRLLYCIPLIIIFTLCSWLFGWFVGDIGVIKFNADDVDYLKLSCTLIDYEPTTITDKKDIQSTIENINSLKHSGKAVKGILKDGIGVGGAVLYEFYFYLKNGESFCVVLSSNSSEQDLTTAEVAYWISQPKSSKVFTDTCRGSLDFFFELYQKNTLGK